MDAGNLPSRRQGREIKRGCSVFRLNLGTHPRGLREAIIRAIHLVHHRVVLTVAQDRAGSTSFLPHVRETGQTNLRIVVLWLCAPSKEGGEI